MEHRVGFGDAGFDEIAHSDPAFLDAWNKIQSQLNAEQAGQSDLAVAKTAMVNAYNGLVSSQPDLSGPEIVLAAQQYVFASRTTVGAIQNIAGLLGTGSGNAPPLQTAMSVMGTMIGAFATAAVATGVLTAGVGAAITAGVALVGEGLAALGLFGGNDPGSSICGATVNPPPGFVVGCVGAYGLIPTKAGPASGAWRRFPDVNSPADNNWFDPQVENFDWGGANWMNIINPGRSPGGSSMIESAFPEFYYLACEVNSAPAGPVGDFQRAFFAAWKANKEYALNGLNPLEDWQVLAHTAVLWNRAHYATSTYDFVPWGDPSSARNRVGGQYVKNITSCNASAVPYERMLVNNVRYLSPVQDMIADGNLRIHTGASKSFHINPGLISHGGIISHTSPASTSSSTAAKVATGAVVVAGGGLLTAAIIAHMRKESVSFVLGQAWKKTKGVFRR